MLKPIHDEILLKEIESKNKENGYGVIVSVNNDDTKNNDRLIKCEGFIDENGNNRKIDSNISVGKVVIIDKYSGSKIVDDDGTEYILAKQIEVMAVSE